MIAIPEYKKMADSFGELVDVEGEDSLYLLDTSFFTPPNPFTVFVSEKGEDFRGDFFRIYKNILLGNKIDESDPSICISLMNDVEAYFSTYLEFLRTAIDSGLPVRTTRRVKEELIEKFRMHMDFKKGALSVELEPLTLRLVSRKKSMALKQDKYIKNICGRGGLLSVIEGNGIITPEELKEEVYRETENLLKANSYRWTRKQSRGTDEDLLATGLAKASEGQKVVILTNDQDFAKELRGIYREDHLEQMRQSLLAGRGLCVAYVARDGLVRKAADTNKLAYTDFKHPYRK